MKKIIGYLRDYLWGVNKWIFILSCVFVASFIFANYHYHLNKHIGKLDDTEQYFCWYFIFLTAFSFPYLLYAALMQHNFRNNKKFLLLVFLAPAIFSWKMVFEIDLPFSASPLKNAYWNAIAYWPLKFLVICSILFLVWKLMKEKEPFYGTSLKNFNPRPYLVMLLIMVPLIAAASTQADFLAMYPKLQSTSFLNKENNGWYKLIYELSYGSDFFSIELFFRGFLVLAFSKWFGKDAILPMAMFYCTIHFGKPLGECISSFFGGMILGVITYHTRTIFGGLMVHLGIAWLMELGGFLGNSF